MGLQTGLISSGLSRLADSGGGEMGGGCGAVIWAPFIHSLPVNYFSFSCRQHCHLGCPDTTESPALTEAPQWDTQADKCTWRLKTRKTAETHRFVNITIFARVIIYFPSPKICQALSVLSWSIVHYFEGTEWGARLISSSRMVKGEPKLPLMPNKSNWIHYYLLFFKWIKSLF